MNSRLPELDLQPAVPASSSATVNTPKIRQANLFIPQTLWPTRSGFPAASGQGYPGRSRRQGWNLSVERVALGRSASAHPWFLARCWPRTILRLR